MLHAFVLIDVEPGVVRTVAEALADLPGVAEVHSVTGRCDLLAVVRVRHHDDLAEVVTGGISAVPGIRGTETMVAFQAFSRHDLDALWSAGAE